MTPANDRSPRRAPLPARLRHVIVVPLGLLVAGLGCLTWTQRDGRSGSGTCTPTIPRAYKYLSDLAVDADRVLYTLAHDGDEVPPGGGAADHVLDIAGFDAAILFITRYSSDRIFRIVPGGRLANAAFQPAGPGVQPIVLTDKLFLDRDGGGAAFQGGPARNARARAVQGPVEAAYGRIAAVESIGGAAGRRLEREMTSAVPTLGL